MNSYNRKEGDNPFFEAGCLLFFLQNANALKVTNDF